MALCGALRAQGEHYDVRQHLWRQEWVWEKLIDTSSRFRQHQVDQLRPVVWGGVIGGAMASGFRHSLAGNSAGVL